MLQLLLFITNIFYMELLVCMVRTMYMVHGIILLRLGAVSVCVDVFISVSVSMFHFFPASPLPASLFPSLPQAAERHVPKCRDILAKPSFLAAHSAGGGGAGRGGRWTTGGGGRGCGK